MGKSVESSTRANILCSVNFNIYIVNLKWHNTKTSTIRLIGDVHTCIPARPQASTVDWPAEVRAGRGGTMRGSAATESLR